MSPRLCATLACLLFHALAQAGSASVNSDRMDEVARYYVDNEQFMGSVLVARGDEVLFGKAYGSANLEWNVPNTVSTKFRIGSVTKQFTATAILLLEERSSSACTTNCSSSSRARRCVTPIRAMCRLRGVSETKHLRSAGHEGHGLR